MDMTSRSGSVVGSYVLGEVVGRGGMGVVHRATKVETGEDVALKLMAPELSFSPEFRQRFLDEGAVGPIIDHPNVIPVYESGDADGELYISMKLIEGCDLKEVLRREGALEPKRALRLFRQIGSALDAAHEAGMIHRDIKPQNILVATDDDGSERAYVSDFGLVKPISSDTTASRTGQVFGSLPYMAPEQIEAMEVDGRADVYSLACVLFEVLTGTPPFERPNEVAVVWAHVHEDPPVVSSLRKDVPGGIDSVVIQALSKHPDDRYLTCGEFIDAFEQGLGSGRSRVVRSMRPLVARIPRQKSEREVWGPNFFPELSRVRKVTNRTNWGRITAFVASAALILSLQVSREGGVPEAVQDAAGAITSAAESLLSRAPGTDRGRQDYTLGSESASSQDEASGSTSASASLDGATDRRVELAKDHVAGGRRSRTTGTSGKAGTEWLFFTRAVAGAGDDIFMISPSGRQLTRITTNEHHDLQPDLAPGGDRLVFSTSRWGRRFLLTSRLDGRGVFRLTTAYRGFDLDPEWSPNGDLIVYADHTWSTYDSYTATWTLDGGVVTTIRPDGKGRTGLAKGTMPSWSPDGRRIVFVRDGDIFAMDRRGRNVRQLTDTSASEADPTWSPDGRYVLFASDLDLFVMDADGSNRRRLTQTPAQEDVNPVWSRDGSRIAWASKQQLTNQWDIWIMDADGTDVKNLTNDAAKDYAVDWGVTR